MNVQDVIIEAKKRGVLFYLKDGNLAYKAKKNSLSPELQIKIKNFKDEIKAFLQKSKDKTEKFILPPLTMADIDGPISLSFAQQRLWFIDQLGEGSTQYNVLNSLMLSGKFNVDAFNKALKSLLERHEILRTKFIDIDGQPKQVITDDYDLRFMECDLSTLDHTEKGLQVKKISLESSLIPFDLSEDLMLRGYLFKLSSDQHLIFYIMHHIISDGWSGAIFKRELKSLYEAYSAGKENPLTPLTIQYADYALWQRRWLQGEVLETQKGYWRKQLSGIPAVHNLPLDKPRPAQQIFEGRRHHQTIDSHTSKRIIESCDKHNVTLFMFMQTAFAVLLSRYSNETDIVVGTPIAGRTHRDLESLIGFFINALVLRTDLSNNPKFSQLLQKNKDVILNAYEHEHIPFEMLVDDINPARSLSHNPLFQIMFALQNHGESDLGYMDNDSAETGGSDTPSSESKKSIRFDLHVHVREVANSLSVTWLYNESLFEQQTISNMARHYSHVLNSIVESLLQPFEEQKGVEELALLHEIDRQQLLVDWNSTDVTYPQNTCLHEIFEEQVKCTPNNIAVVYGDEQLTYRELNDSANRLAYFLIDCGIKPESKVVIYLERSINTLISVLAILKAGGAYVPLDVSYPSSRLEYMIKDCGTNTIISQTKHAEHVLTEQVRWIYLDDPNVINRLDSYLDADPDKYLTAVTPCNLAYVIYTSGSTGTPKGVLVEHKSVVDYCYYGMFNYYSDNLDGSFIISTLSFDATVTNLYLPLFKGGSVEFAPENIDMGNFWSKLEKSTKNLMLKLTPSHIKTLPDRPLNQLTNQCKHTFVIGGELLTQALLEKVKSRFPLSDFYHHYGPTETIVGSTIVNVTQYQDSNRKGVPIGKPMANTSLYILNRLGEVCPLGVPGELYIGGVGLARGYENKSGFVSERFIPNRFSSYPGERLYCTGDLVRYLPDGNIEFLGRLDEQIKLRGFRVELAEIEAALLLIQEVIEVAVVVQNDEKIGAQLVAYVVRSDGCIGEKIPQEEKNALVVQYKAHLNISLPEFMVPNIYIFLDSIPLTTNRKVNKRALPLPQDKDFQLEPYVGARNKTEEELCHLWQDILVLKQVSIFDNFFSLGGHSLLATQLVSAIRQKFTIELPLKAVFEFPTVEALSRYIGEKDKEAILPPVYKVDRQQILPLSFAQQRLWFIDQLEENAVQYNIQSRFMQHGDFKVDALKQALTSIFERHEVLRTHFIVIDGAPTQSISNDYKVPFTFHDFSILDDSDKALRTQQLIKEDAQARFDLSKDLMLRVNVIKFSGNDHLIILTMHHIASDGWSVGIFRNELNTLYKAYCQGRSNPLPALKVQYADYAAWQRQWLQGDMLASLLSYWRQKLINLPTLHSLPLDKPRPTKQTYLGKVYRQHLSNKMTKHIKSLCEENQVTLFMFLQTAFAVLIGRYSHKTDIVMGTPVAGRNHSDIEPLIGFFINMLVLRTDLTRNSTFSSLLKTNKENILEAYANQYFPFEMLVDELDPGRDMSHNPVIQILFAVQNNERGMFDFGNENTIDNAQKNKQENSRRTVNMRFDIELNVNELNDSLSISWGYNESLFEEHSILRMADNYEVLLKSIIDELSVEERATLDYKESPVSVLTMLSEADKQQLNQWNHSPSRGQTQKCLHESFVEQAAKTPNAIALSCNGEYLSYELLNRQANKLANYLIKQGVSPDIPVGICTEYSLEMLIGVLGVLKSGASYLLLSPEYSPFRLSYLLEDSGVDLLLTQSKMQLIEKVAEMLSVQRKPLDKVKHLRCINLDKTSVVWHEKPIHPNCYVTPLNCASVIYKSHVKGGTIGLPITHQSLNNFASNDSLQYCVDSSKAADKIVSSYDDIANGDWSIPLLHGGTLLLAHRPMIEPVDVSLPSYYFTPRSIDGIKSFKSKMNMTCYVLDTDGELAPQGGWGELCIAEDGLSSGYLNRAGVTAGAFVPNPFSQLYGQRLYRTECIARYLPDGSLENKKTDRLMFSHDTCWINSTKIETVVLKHPLVTESVIVEFNGDNKGQFVAYVVLDENNKKAIEADKLAMLIREQIKHEALLCPLPCLVIELDEMPLRSDGEIDIKALPKPQRKSDGQLEYLAPKSEIQKLLCLIWQEALDIEKVSINDNFFSLGGHSLIATRLVNSIRQKLNIELPVRALFESPTIAELCTRPDMTEPGDDFVLPDIEKAERYTNEAEDSEEYEF